MTVGITSTLSPGYLQVNPNYIKSASKLRKQNESAFEKPEIESKEKPEETVIKLENVSSGKFTVDKELSERDKAIIAELEKMEREVISHEIAHMSTGGGFTGSPKYTRVFGPDGKSYISGGEISISVPSSSDPKETIRNMEQVKAAALAPIDPSSQDLNVAAVAANAESQAAAQLAAQHAEWGVEPQPARNNFDDTDRVPAQLPAIKKYQNSVHNEETSGVISSINLTREESINIEKSSTDLNRLTEHESSKYYSKVAPEDNLYYTRLARSVYFLSSSPKGLWTINNGFEKTLSSPALIIAQAFSIAA
jgi:hypothetical protein